MLSTASLEKYGIDLIRHASRRLLWACIQADPRSIPPNEDKARAFLKRDRQYAPTGYPGILDIRMRGEDAQLDITQIGDAYVALDTAGRTAEVLEGAIEARPYRGELILGKEKAIDLFKAELKRVAQEKYPDISDQFFYDLIFNGTFRQQFLPTSVPDLDGFKVQVKRELREYACAKYSALTPDVFDAMIENGMTPWQQRVAQNNPDAGPFWYPALDPIGDTPEEGITHWRIRIHDVLAAPHPRVVLWTDGSSPSSDMGISLATLKGINAYGERTELEVTIDGTSGIYVSDVGK